MPISKRKAQTIRHGLSRAYSQLVPKLGRLTGYRVAFHRETPDFEAQFAYSASGDLLYRIDSPLVGTFGYLELDKSGALDAFATKILGRFRDKAKRLFADCWRDRSIDQTLIREEEFFWDDLIVGFKYPKHSHYALIQTLWALRAALHFRYEGELPKVGVLLTWNIKEFVEKTQSSSIPLVETPLLEDLLAQSKAAHLLSDGEAAIYVVKGARAVELMYRSSTSEFSKNAGWEFVPPQYRWLRPAVQGRDLVIINSGVGEQIMITSRAVLKWVGGQWTRLSHTSISQLLPAAYSDELKQVILDVLGRLSHQHVGALIVLPEDLPGFLKSSSAGLSKHFSGRGFLKLSPLTRSFFERLCGIDGGVIVDKDGTIVDAGVIVNIPSGSPAEGARSNAAFAASIFGVAIKVSHDGPITIFKQGQRVATVS